MANELRVLVTGGAGYLGSILVGRLLSEGHHVTVLDNLLYNQYSLFHFSADRGFDFVFGDVRDETVMRELVGRHDAIVHLAAIVGAKTCDRDPILTRTVNYESVLLLNRLRSRNQMVVFPCTNSGYGTRTGELHCTEETPLEPISLYGKTKVEAEKALLDHGSAVCLRLATVFGMSPRMRLDLLVNDFTYKAVTQRYLVLYEKHFKRNYIGIEDVARCFCFALENFGRMEGKPYNVGLNDANLSKEELALKIKEYVPELYIHDAEVGSDPDRRNYIVSNDRILATGFRTTQSLDEGIRQLLKGYRMIRRTEFTNA
jgi:nucleoside-diphosphate-sugar epimerase